MTRETDKLLNVALIGVALGAALAMGWMIGSGRDDSQAGETAAEYLVSPSASSAVPPAVGGASLRDRLWRAICQVESGGDPNAVGDGGKSHGIAQIGRLYLADANEHAGTAYTLVDMYDPAKARAVFDAYMDRWCPNGTAEDIARTHNGGPSWKRRAVSVENTARYWHKVQREMER